MYNTLWDIHQYLTKYYTEYIMLMDTQVYKSLIMTVAKKYAAKEIFS